jgi:hypothetical protein
VAEQPTAPPATTATSTASSIAPRSVSKTTQVIVTTEDDEYADDF